MNIKTISLVEYINHGDAITCTECGNIGCANFIKKGEPYVCRTIRIKEGKSKEEIQYYYCMNCALKIREWRDKLKTTYYVQACSGGRWPEIYKDQKEAFDNAVENANISKKDVYLMEHVDGREEDKQLLRINRHLIDDLGYYNPTEVWNLVTGYRYFVRHEVSTYGENLRIK